MKCWLRSVRQLGRWDPSDPGDVAPLCVPQVTPWVVGTLSVMGPCWYMEKKTNLFFLLICISVLSPALPMDPGEQVPLSKPCICFFRRSSVVNVVVILICWLFCNRSRCCRFDVLIVLQEEQMMLF